jgi:hypothetical protein
MKINGESFNGPNEALIVLVRNGNPVPFKARACLDFTRFDALCVKPMPKKITKVGGQQEYLFGDPTYLQAIDQYGKLKTAYVILESLKATPGLEFETVRDDNPSTWMNWRKEFEAAFFTEQEINRVIGCVWEANGIDEDKLEEARKRFLAGQDQEPEKST